MSRWKLYYDTAIHAIRYRMERKKLDEEKYRFSSKHEVIPRKIHYCWFGKNPEPELMQACMASWRKYLPDYELVLWNEDNFPIAQYEYALGALKNKKWAFLSDIARLHVLYYHGGIYMDTDVEVLKNLDCFLDHGAFSGYESQRLIPTGIMGAKQYHPWIALLLSWYEGREFESVTCANTQVISKLTRLHYGIRLQNEKIILPNDLHIYPKEYFAPRDWWGEQKLNLTERSYCIHHFAGSWK